jgi:SnoaL-like domain
MSHAGNENQDPLAWARQFQAEQVAYLTKGDVDGLLRHFYSQDARMASFDFHARGHAAINQVIQLYLDRTADLGPRKIESFVAGQDFIWFELGIQAPQDDIKTYELKFLRDNKIELELLGFTQGTLWKPGDFADVSLPETGWAMRLHDDYVQYHINGDADGLVDDLFTEDARLITQRLVAEGREAVRQVFRDIFARESHFEARSVEKITCDTDYIWFEASVTSSLGARRLYDVMKLRDGKICLQFVGRLEGAMPTEQAMTGHP